MSPNTAWRTLARINQGELKEGYPVLLERGSIFRETLYITQSGTADKPFTVSSYGEGKAPVISGADLISSWKSEGGGVYSAKLASWPQHVWHGKARLEFADGRPSAGQFTFENGWLYVNLEGGENPNDQYIEASVRDSAVRDETGQRYVTLNGLVGEKTNGTSINDAIFNAHWKSDHWTVTNSVARFGAANGFFAEQNWTRGIGSYLLVKDSESAYNRRRGAVAAGYEEVGQVFDNFYSHHNRSDGLLVNSSNGVLKNSQLEYNGFGGGSKPKHGVYIYPFKGDSAKNWQISNNVLNNNRDSGARITGSGHEIYGNTISDSPYALFIVDTDGPNAAHLVEDNLFRNTDPDAFAIEIQGVEKVRIRANRFYNSSGVGLIRGQKRNSSNVTVLDNVFAGNPINAYIELDDAQNNNFSESNNCFDVNIKVREAAPETVLTTQNAGRDRIYLPNCK